MSHRHKFLITAICLLSVGLAVSPLMLKHALADKIKNCSKTATGNPITVAGRNLYCSFYFNINGTTSTPPITVKTALWNWPDAYQDTGSGYIDDTAKDDAGSLTNWMHQHLGICGNPFRLDQCPHADTQDDVFRQALATVVGDSYIVNTQLGRVGNDFTPPDSNTYCNNYSGQNRQGLFCGIEYAQDNFTAWKALVTQYDANHQIDWFDKLYGPDVKNIPNAGPCDHSDTLIYAFGVNPFGQITDEIPYDNVECGQGVYIVFKDTAGNVLYRINRDCGNVTGTIKSLATIDSDIHPVPTPQQPILNPTDENPTSATFNWSVIINGTNKNVKNFKVTTDYFVEDTTGTKVPGSDFGPSNYNFNQIKGGVSKSPGPFTYAIPISVSPGYYICEDISTPQTIILNDDGSYTGIGTNDPPPACREVVHRPYLSMYGNDVFAGGALNVGAGTCGAVNNTADIWAWIGNSSLGAGSQFAAYATNSILNTLGSGFNSARLRDPTAPKNIAAPNPPTGLDMGSTGSSLGGFTPGTCSGNYKFSTSDTPLPFVTLNAKSEHVIDVSDLNNLTDNSRYFYGSDLELINQGCASGSCTTFGLSTTKRLVIYIKGDLIVQRDVKYANTTTWSSPSDIPSLTFIVQGNILISHDASAIDGNYIAEQASSADTPNGEATASGAIFTCTKSDGPFFWSLPSLYTNCPNQLVVHGRLLANVIFWLRSYSTRADGTNDNNLNPYAQPSLLHAAEVIISGPEDYIALPAGSKTGKIQSITGLPPVL